MNDELEETGVSKCESIYRTRKCRSKMKMIKTLISCGNFNDQCDVLESFLMDSQLEEHRSKLNIFNQKESKKIAFNIVKERKLKNIDTQTLVQIIEKTKKKKNFKVHAATKTFQAIRIFVAACTLKFFFFFVFSII